MSDLISRRDAIDAVHRNYDTILDFKSDGRTVADSFEDIINALPSAQPETDGFCDGCKEYDSERHFCPRFDRVIKKTVEEMGIIHCKDCKHWKRQTNYQGAPLSFGFCESDDMWRSLYGETYEISHIDTDDDFYCGYAERREEEG